MELHLVSNLGAAASLQEAIRSHGVAGAVFSSEDDYSVGPLTDGYLRSAFWRECSRGYDSEPEIPESPAEAIDLFAYWSVFRGNIAQSPPSRIVVWSSASAAEYVFLRMACRQLSAEAV